MHKAVFFSRFRDDVDRAEAERQYAEEHAELTLAVPGIVRFVQNPVVTAATLVGVAEDRPVVDSFDALWFANRDAFLDAMASPEWQRVREAASVVLDQDGPVVAWASEIEERVKREGLGARQDGIGTPPAGPVKLIGILRYRSDLAREDCNAYWAGPHGDLALRISQIGHYTQNHAIRPIISDKLAIDGFSESWYADQQTYEDAMASAEWRALAEDGDNLFDMSAFKSVIVAERVLCG